MGVVFRFYNRIPTLTAKENVEIAAMLCKDTIPAESEAKELSEKLNEIDGIIIIEKNYHSCIYTWENENAKIA